MTLAEIVTHYIRTRRAGARAELRDFENERSPSAAIRRAALCELPSGKRHPHQRRIPRVLLEEVEDRLQAIGRKLANAPDFATLYGLVHDKIGKIKGIGALTVYDVSHRIGGHFGMAPELVYLHAGTRTGARALNIAGDSVDPKNLPREFSRLAASEIEDCLCIYKSELQGNASGQVSPRGAGCDAAIRLRGCV
jgi:hypothetical protein